MTKSEVRKGLTVAKRTAKRHQRLSVKNYERLQKARHAVLTFEHEMKFHSYEQKRAEQAVQRLTNQLAALSKSKRRV